MIENFNEVKTYLESNQNNEEIKSYLQGLNKITLDGVKSFLETDEQGKGYLQSYTDSKVTKGIETFKQNNLQKLVDEEIRKRNPSTDPRDIAMAEMQKTIEDMKRESLVKELKLNVSQTMTEKKIPLDFMNYIIGQDEETTMNNLTALENALCNYSKAVREQILKDGSYTPSKSNSKPITVNPYSKESFSLTQQMELERTNPTLAKQYQEVAMYSK